MEFHNLGKHCSAEGCGQQGAKSPAAAAAGVLELRFWSFEFANFTRHSPSSPVDSQTLSQLPEGVSLTCRTNGPPSMPSFILLKYQLRARCPALFFLGVRM